MKTKIKNLLGAAIMMVLPLSFTSCDDILGHWEKPVADVFTPTTFKVFNPQTNMYEKMDLSIYDFTTLTPSNVAGLLSSGTLSAGKYIVEGNVNYNGDINVGGDGKLELYIQDNASLTITGGLNAGDIEGIKIAGQKDGSGKLTITADSGDGITAKTLTIDGGKLTVEGGGYGAKLGNEGTLTVNGGDHTIKGNSTTEPAIYGNLVFNNGRLIVEGAAKAIDGNWTLAKDTQLRDLTTGETARADGGVYTGPFLFSHIMEIYFRMLAL